MRMDTHEFFGLDVAVLTQHGAVTLLEDKIKGKFPSRVAFLNANLANVAYEDATVRDMLQHFLLLNDGSGINLANRVMYGQPFPENLNGTDFTPYFLDHCKHPLRIFLLGAAPAVLKRTVRYFDRRWPKHRIVGFQHGFFPEKDEEKVFLKIKESNPSLVLVAMGNGLQEHWVEKLVPDVALSAWGVGALFDFLCGEVTRAPAWMRGLGIEWTYRLLQEPGRMWRRYLMGNPKFVMRVLREFGSRGGFLGYRKL